MDRSHHQRRRRIRGDSGDVARRMAQWTEDRRCTDDTDLFSHGASRPSVTGCRPPDGRCVLDEPVLVDVQVTTSERRRAFPGVHVDVPSGSVTYPSRSDTARHVERRGDGRRSGASRPHVGDNARLVLTVVQDWNYATRAIGRGIVTLDRDAGLVLSEIGLGGLLRSTPPRCRLRR